MRLCCIGAALAALLLSTSALAGEPAKEEPAQKVFYERYSVVTFGDDTIEGDLASPDNAYIEAKKRRRHESLIRTRESFRVEVLESLRGL